MLEVLNTEKLETEVLELKSTGNSNAKNTGHKQIRQTKTQLGSTLMKLIMLDRVNTKDNVKIKTRTKINNAITKKAITTEDKIEIESKLKGSIMIKKYNILTAHIVLMQDLGQIR